MSSVVILAFLIGVGYLIILRNVDYYDKEPIWVMLISFALGGMVSIVVTTILYSFVTVEHTFAHAIFRVGLVEELAKLLTLFIIYPIIKKHFDEIVDGIVYMSCIALGFSVIENISYAEASTNPMLLLFGRSVTATFGHMAFSGIMGVAAFIHLKVRKNYFGLLLSLAIAALAHGLYDGVLFEAHLNWLFAGVFISILLAMLWVLRLTLSFSRFRIPFSVSLFSPVGDKNSEGCLHCESNTETKAVQFWKITMQTCSSCGYGLFHYTHWKQVLRYYRPIIKWKTELKRYERLNVEVEQFGQFNEHKNSFKKQLVSCNTDSLGNWLYAENEKDKAAILNIPIVGLLLKGIGLRFLKN